MIELLIISKSLGRLRAALRSVCRREFGSLRCMTKLMMQLAVNR